MLPLLFSYCFVNKGYLFTILGCQELSKYNLIFASHFHFAAVFVSLTQNLLQLTQHDSLTQSSNVAHYELLKIV